MAPKQRKNPPRERLLQGMIEVANRRGYLGATVSAVIGEAGISRPTFYEYFSDRDDCFRASADHVREQLLAAIATALESLDAGQATAAAVRALVDFADAEPSAARFLMAESMAGGSHALDIRDRAIAELAAAITRARRNAADAEAIPDLEPRVLFGAIFRVLATRLRRGETGIGKLSDELLPWFQAYARPASELRWQTLAPCAAPARSPHVPDAPIQHSPDILPPGRPRISAQEIAENHRLRILYAAASLAAQKGYLSTTVADITKLARIDGTVFYRHFADKQEVLSAVHERGFQQVMDVTAKAFFASEQWPQRSWEAARALTQLLQENPLIAHVGFVDAYAVGPAAVQRIEDSHTAFMFFLQEGLVQRPELPPPSRVAMEAVISAIFEVIYLQVRRPGKLVIAAMLAQVAHLWLTPFLGVAQSDAFIDAQAEQAAARKRGAARKS